MPRKVFTPQFKETAVRLASAPGAVVEKVSHELGVATWTLRRWMKEQLGTSRKTPVKSPVPSSSADAPSQPDPHARIRQLEAEVRQPPRERHTPTKATAFFAAEDLKQAAGQAKKVGADGGQR